MLRRFEGTYRHHVQGDINRRARNNFSSNYELERTTEQVSPSPVMRAETGLSLRFILYFLDQLPMTASVV
jgi:hypothetical protein